MASLEEGEDCRNPAGDSGERSESLSEVYDLRLMSPVEAESDIPTVGDRVIIVADVRGTLHFRIFEADGRRAVDTCETELADETGRIAELKRMLSGLWKAPRRSQGIQVRVRDAVTSIVGWTLPEHESYGLSPEQFRRIAEAEEKGKVGPAVWLRYWNTRNHPTLMEQLRVVVGEEMRKHKWTQESIAKGAGIEPSVLSNLMQENGGLDLETIEKFFRFFRLMAFPRSWLPDEETPVIDKRLGKGRKGRSDKGKKRKK